MSKTVKYPAMRYHPKNGHYVICHGLADVPDGFLDNIRDVENPDLDQYEGPLPASGDDFAAPKKKAKAKAKVTLKSLKLTRAEALEILVGENIDFVDDADDATIAGLVAEAL